MRLNDIAFVGGKVVAVFAFAGEHVEVIKPKIIHDLLQLPFAVDSAGNFGHGQFFHHALRALAIVGDGARHSVGVNAESAALVGSRSCDVDGRLFHGRGSVGIGVRLCGGPGFRIHLRIAGEDFGCSVGLCLRLLLGFFLSQACQFRGLLGLRILRDKCGGAEAKRGKRFETRFERIIVDGIWIQLLIDPFGEAQLLDALDFAGTRTVGEAIQGMEDGFIDAELGNGQTSENGIGFWLFVFGRKRGVCGV